VGGEDEYIEPSARRNVKQAPLPRIRRGRYYAVHILCSGYCLY